MRGPETAAIVLALLSLALAFLPPIHSPLLVAVTMAAAIGTLFSRLIWAAMRRMATSGVNPMWSLVMCLIIGGIVGTVLGGIAWFVVREVGTGAPTPAAVAPPLVCTDWM